MLIYVNSFLDRQILSLLVEPITKDLGITRSQVGILGGLAFAIFYTVGGIPIGRWVDRWSRRWIIAIGQVFWSLMSAGCGMVHTFWHFFAMRVGLGIGEATLSPAAYSLITDHFPKEKLGRALSVYSMGIYVGGGLSLIFGGTLVDYFTRRGETILPFVGHVEPWQMVFFVIAAPAIPLTLLTFAFKEPLRRGAIARGGKTVQAPVEDVVRYVSDNRATFLCHNLGFGFLSLSGYAGNFWVPTFFAQTYGWSMSKVGVSVGTVTIIFGVLGIFIAGTLSDWMTKKGYSDAKMRVGMIVAWARIPFGIIFPLMPDGNLALLAFVPVMLIISMPFGVAPAAIQEMMPGNMRGQGSAIYLFVINLLGLGLGPYILPAISKVLFGDPKAVIGPLIVVGTVAHILAGILLGLGLKPYRKSLEYLREWKASNA
ncbi:MFS transporter [Candidatus Sumerlaeota bacterium]|nr:MFS transporter [Candidatus Sumerlaeota bacterium]